MTEYFRSDDRGYTYILPNVDQGEQTLQFIRKERTSEEDATLRTMIDGTTTESVIAVVIDRLQLLDSVYPSDFNKDAIMHLEAAFQDLRNRTDEREKRGVEGKDAE